MAHNIKKIFFVVFSCADIQFLKNRSQKALNWSKMAISVLYAYFVGQFCYHSNGKI